jgi:poly(A) polymerase
VIAAVGTLSPAGATVGRLVDQGFAGYVVGGGVRDLLLGIPPKDFDVATSARPEDVRRLFRHSRIIGRRFRLVHVFFGQEIVEVATFRRGNAGTERTHPQFETTASGRLLRDNLYGSEREDAFRRDFTLNALYFDAVQGTIRDWVGGFDDLRDGIIRLIGDPEARYREDPVRMLRAVRFQAKTGFPLEAATAAPLRRLAALLTTVPPARLFEEVGKLLLFGQALRNFTGLVDQGLLKPLFPWTAEWLEADIEGMHRALVERVLRIADETPRERGDQSLILILSGFFWGAARQYMRWHENEGMDSVVAMHRALHILMREQQKHVSIPRRIVDPVESLLVHQIRLDQGTAQPAASRLLHHPAFAASLDFLRLRAQVGDASADLETGWRDYAASTPVETSVPGSDHVRRRRRRRPRRII